MASGGADRDSGSRRSYRSRNPPAWHKDYDMGNPVAFSTPRNRPGPLRTKADDDASVTSRQSAATIRSTASSKRVDLHMDLGHKIKKLEDKKDDMELSIRRENTSLLKRRLEIHKLQKSLREEPLKGSEFEEEIKAKLESLEEEVEKHRDDIASQELIVKKLERSLAFTRQEKALKEAQLTVEGFDDILNTSLQSEPMDKKFATKSWIAANTGEEDSSDEEPMAMKEKVTQENSQKPPEEETDKTVHHQFINSNKIPYSSVDRSKGTQKNLGRQDTRSTVPANPEPTTSLNDKLAEVLLKLAGDKQATTEQRQFMSRQSHLKDLPTFSGKPEHWLSFIGAVNRATVACGYSLEEQLGMLRKALKDEAAKAVESLMSTPENVPAIIKKLEVRFGNPERIIEALISKAKTVPPIKEDKFETVLDFGDAVEHLTTTVKALKRKDHLSNPQLLKELEQKMPHSFRYQWREWILVDPSRSKSLDHFSTWIQAKANLASSMRDLKITDSDVKSSTSGPRGGRGRTVLTVEESKPVTCPFCQRKNHILPACRTFEKEDEEKKWKFVRDKKLCFRCLMPGHWTGKCSSKSTCGKNGCPRSHHSSLHKAEQSKPVEKEEKTPDVNFMGHATANEDSRPVTLLKIVPVILHGPNGSLSVNALCDEGSELTLLDAAVAEQLGLKGHKKPLCIQWTQDIKKTEPESMVVDLKISGDFPKSKRYALKGTRTLKDLSLPMQSLNFERLMEQWPHLRSSKMEPMKKLRPTLLIGQNNWQLIVSREVKSGPADAPGLSKTQLGWVLHGGNFPNLSTPQYIFHVCQSEDDKILHQLIKDSFRLESIGGQKSVDKPKSLEDQRAVQILKETSVHKKEGWETGLLWKLRDCHLPESRKQALLRLHCMERKMDRLEEFKFAYLSKMEEYLTKGYIRKLDPEEIQSSSDRVWYLPHFMHFTTNKKPRLIFDAASKSHGLSLNDFLVSGPDYLSSLPGCLFKFRQRRFAFTADISDMFHRIRIRDEDVQSQRFLWRGIERDQPPGEYVITRMFFGSISSPCSSQFIKNKNAEENREEFPEAYKAIVNRHYMDDYSDSSDTVEQGVQLCQEVIEVHRRGGFPICKFNSNSRELLSHIPVELHCTELKELTEEKDLPTGRTLGLWWDSEKDVITWKINSDKIKPQILNGTVPTKREVLKLVMSIFDPLGFLSNFIIRARIIYQDIWRTEIGWDQEVPDTINDRWQDWIQELKKITGMEIPRCYSPAFSTALHRQLHIFCDASTEAYSVVCYFRFEHSGRFETAFVTGKAKVAPLKSISVPRMELEAALMGSRMGKFIQDEHEVKVDSTFFWTDSMTVLKWIRSDSRRFNPFVSHRIGEMQELTDVDQWKWIPGKENPADDATRGKSPTDLTSESRWLTGPTFLKFLESEWPQELATLICDDEELELRPMYVNTIIIHSDFLPQVDRFNYKKLLRITSWMLRFVHNSRHPSEKRSLHLTPEELIKAEEVWWRKVQSDTFEEERDQLSNGLRVQKGSKLKSLSPYLDQFGVLRVSGRLEKSTDLSLANKRPVILDPHHPFSKRLIYHYHQDIAHHHGREMVLNELRQRYWILNCRAAVKRAWNECQFCKNRRAVPMVPEMGQLPEARITQQVHPFTCTGMDYFGPMEVVIGRRHEKRYGVLFTCMTTRAVHLEVAASLTTDSAIMAIRRMAARRGHPKEIFSDNGTNLRGAEVELRKALTEIDQGQMGEKMTSMGISWHFNPPSAPHTGGSWERMVRSVKTALKETLKVRTPREEVLHTLLTEAESIVNSRPLTYVSDDPNDKEAISPNHFLIGRSRHDPAPGAFTDADICLRKQWRISQRLTEIFWKQWTRSYLPNLIRRPKWNDPMKPVVVGDVVKLIMDSTPRNAWPLGRITAVFPGDDGKVRVVDVKTQDATYRRPVAKLCVLDLEGVKPDKVLGGKKCTVQTQQLQG